MEGSQWAVRWPEEAPGLGQGDEGSQGLPLVELPHKNSGEDAEPEAEAAAVEVRQHAPDAGALAEGGRWSGCIASFWVVRGGEEAAHIM